MPESRSRSRCSLLSTSDSSTTELGTDEGLEESTGREDLTVVRRSVKSDEGSVGVEVVHAREELGRVLRGYWTKEGRVSVRRDAKQGTLVDFARLTSLDSTGFSSISLSGRSTKGTGGESESVRDFEGAVRVDTEELPDSRSESDGRVRGVGGSRVNDVGFARVLDDLHQSLYNGTRS